MNTASTHPKITPCLWFDGNGGEAIKHYTAIFNNSGVEDVSHQGKDAQLLAGTFLLNGQEFMVLNGGPQFKFNEAISLMVNCETQEEVDYYWERLSEGGETGRCGWLKDKFGVSWQVVPTILSKLMSSPDRERGQRVMQQLMKMTKLDIQPLQDAADGK